MFLFSCVIMTWFVAALMFYSHTTSTPSAGWHVALQSVAAAEYTLSATNVYIGPKDYLRIVFITNQSLQKGLFFLSLREFRSRITQTLNRRNTTVVHPLENKLVIIVLVTVSIFNVFADSYKQ